MRTRLLLRLLAISLIAACNTGDDPKGGSSGADGSDGTDAADGTDGTDGADGADGTDGSDGADGTDGGDPMCLEGPSAGTVSTDSSCEYVPEASGNPFSARVEWSMAHALTDPSDSSITWTAVVADAATSSRSRALSATGSGSTVRDCTLFDNA